MLDGPRHTDNMTYVSSFSMSSLTCNLLSFRGLGKLDGLPPMMVQLAALIMGKEPRLLRFIFQDCHPD